MDFPVFTIVTVATASFLAIRSAPPAPAANRVEVVRIAADGTVESLAAFAHADVSSVARMKDGRIIAACQGYPPDDEKAFNRTAIRFSSDDGRTWTAATPITVAGLDSGLAPPFDPTLVVLPDGRVRLYFISYPTIDGRPGPTAVHSAISGDGIRFEFEPGIRLAAEGRVVVDAAAALHAGTFHLIVPDNGTPADFLGRRQRGEPQSGGNGYHATSADGLAFTRVADLPLPSSRDRWFGNLLADGGTLLFFGTGPGPWPVASTDGMTWKATAAAVPVSGVDPAVVRLADGSWLVLSTREPSSAP
jgi:hypothetical protein